MKKTLIITGLFFLSLAFTSCEKLLNDKADNQISDLKDLMQTPEDAKDVLNGAYDVLVNGLDGQIQIIDELLSDNLAEPTTANNNILAVYGRSTNYFNDLNEAAYMELYRAIFRANLVLKYTKDIPGISESEKSKLENEARFIRAIGHFWVLKTFAQPWGYSANNSHLGIVIRDEPVADPLPRSSVAEVYTFIQDDLKSAVNALPENNGFYANKYSAAALLAYTYFLQNDYGNCITYSDLVINSGQYSLEPTIDVFHALDSIYQFQPNPEMIFGGKSNAALFDERNEEFGNYYQRKSAQGAILSLTQECYDLFASNQIDNRNEWVEQVSSQYVLKKFGTITTYNNNVRFYDVPVLRLTMIKLIRAEAIASSGNGNLSDAIQDINDIRERAFGNDLLNLPANSTAIEVKNAAQLEFRKEMVGEGYYVDQLKRRGVLGENIIIRNAPWNCDGMAIQFPDTEGTGADFIYNPEGGCN